MVGGLVGGGRANGVRRAGLWLITVGLLLSFVILVPGCASPQRGRYHTVASGENLYRIGLKYGVGAPMLARVNRIRDVTHLRVGQKIWVPEPRSSSSVTRSASGKKKASGSATSSSRRARSGPARSAGGLIFIWPLEATTITSRFGRRNGRPHQGIDLRGRTGTRIRAAEAGKVIHSGWLGDYGKVVIIKHPGHYRTVYAHASKLHVKRGQFVDRGQRIAEVGSTGRSTGPHLHFEVRYGESPLDPMLYLP